MPNGFYGFPAPQPEQPAPSGLVRIARFVVGGGGSAYFLIPGLPQSFSMLEMSFVGRTDNAVTVQGCNMQVGTGNPDTGSNYSSQHVQAAAAVVAASEYVNGTSLVTGAVPGASSPAGAVGMMFFQFLDYATWGLRKPILQLTGRNETASSGGIGIRHLAGFWFGTTPIDTIKLYPGAGNFVAGSSLTVWGRL